MKTTKKLLLLCLIAIMAIVAVMPSTFSWYAHNGETNYRGNQMVYEKSDLPLSLKRASGLTMKTYIADNFGKKNASEVSWSSSATVGNGKKVQPGNTQRYVTTITNNNQEKDVYADLEISKISNNANVFVGTCEPVVNEKSYASRATLEKVDWDYEVIYFEPRDHFEWWQDYYAPSSPFCDQNQGISYSADEIDPVTDMNLEYQVGAEAFPMAMQKCSGGDTVDEDTFDVYRAIIPTDAGSLFFFNHYYIAENTNIEWNRTPTVNDFAEGRVYYLNGGTNNYNNKDLSYHDSFNGTNICVYNYYKTATMAAGKTADLSLKRGNSDMIANRESFDYTGKTISYASSLPNYISVSKDGLVTAKDNSAGRSATITTTIEGEFGDLLQLQTQVSVPSEIEQVPIVQNIKIPAGKTVNITWYVKNASGSNATFDNIFLTI